MVTVSVRMRKTVSTRVWKTVSTRVTCGAGTSLPVVGIRCSERA
jgi:hypothetical protein